MKVKDDDAFCSKCGKRPYGERRTIPQQQSSSYKVYQDTKSQVLPRTKKKKKHMPIVITAILLLAVIGLCSFFAIRFFSAYRSSISDRYDSALETGTGNEKTPDSFKDEGSDYYEEDIFLTDGTLLSEGSWISGDRTTVSAGGDKTAVIKQDGSLWAWGADPLGDGKSVF